MNLSVAHHVNAEIKHKARCYAAVDRYAVALRGSTVIGCDLSRCKR